MVREEGALPLMVLLLLLLLFLLLLTTGVATKATATATPFIVVTAVDPIATSFASVFSVATSAVTYFYCRYYVCTFAFLFT